MFIDKGVNLSLPNYYSIYIPSKSIMQGYLHNESLRDVLLLLALLIHENQYVDIVFEECSEYVDCFNGYVNLSEVIGGREYQMELFIRDKLGFFSGELSMKAWISHILFVFDELNQSFVT